MTTEIRVTNRLFHELVDEVAAAFAEAGDDITKPLLPYCKGAWNDPKVVWPTATQMKLVLARIMTFIKTNAKGVDSDTAPPNDVVRAMLEMWKETHEEAAQEAQLAHIRRGVV